MKHVMKLVTKPVIVAGAIFASSVATADLNTEFRPFIGVDYLQTWMASKGNLANTNLNIQDALRKKKSFPSARAYIGTKVTEYFGIELGADWAVSKKQTISGPTTVGANTFTYTNKNRREGYHVDLVGFMPIDAPMDCWEIFGSLGYGVTKIKFSDQATTSTGTVAQQAAFNQQFPLTVKRKGVVRVGVGANYMVTDMFGLRAKLGWENTNSMRLKYNNGATAKAFKDSINVSWGGFVRF